MLLAAAWMLFILGIGHLILGLIWFKKPVLEACGEGFIGKFMGIDTRRLAFWFVIFGPLLAMSGHVSIHAASSADQNLLKILGFYMLAISLTGVLALPKSPFWVVLFLSPVFIAGGYGWAV